jgi:outer membrane putative beta-barrel porin/alpha-amylase
MKTPFLFIAFFALTFAQAQEEEPIQADRPDQTETPAIVPKGIFQVEMGLTYQRNDTFSESYSLPSVLWKYGVNDNFELRAITEFVLDKSATAELSGFNSVLVGCKIKICEENGMLPKTSFIGHLSLPNVASTNYKTDYFAPQFRFVMQHTLSAKFSLSYNLGSEWDGFTAEPTFIYTLTTGCTFTKKLGGYVEFFGFAPQEEKAEHNFDGGLTYLVNNDFMLDLSAGVGITDNARDYYLAVGCSFRI